MADDIQEPNGDGHHPLRKPCHQCGGEKGKIIEKGAQDTVRCLGCNTFQYNAPRAETGKEVRHVKTRELLKPGFRAEILARDNGRCVLCGTGAKSEPLHVGHLLSIVEGKKLGLTEDDLNVEENLAAMCDACNLGLSQKTLPLRLWASILMGRKV